MKKLLLSLVVTAVLAAPALAQDQKDFKKDHAAWDKKIKDELKLTDEQAVKYDALSKEYSDKMEALKQDNTLTAEAQKEKKMELKKEKEARLFEFITPEQQTKYKELVEKKKKEIANKSGS